MQNFLVAFQPTEEYSDDEYVKAANILVVYIYIE